MLATLKITYLGYSAISNNVFYAVGKFCTLFIFLMLGIYGADSKIEALPKTPKAAPVHPEKPKSFKLMPHRAVYDVAIHPSKKSNDPTVKEVTGSCEVKIVKTKDGWQHNQYLDVQVHYYDGTTTTVKRNMAMWESPSESSFHIENSRDGSTESILHGGAKLVDNKWQVFFETPEMDGFINDNTLVFPLMYLEKILETIEQQKAALSNQVIFDASYELQKPVRVDTLIVPVKDKKISVKNDSLMPSDKLWHLQMAFYDIDFSHTDPDYDPRNVYIFSTGVISSMETSWGEGITIVLNLKELTVYQ